MARAARNRKRCPRAHVASSRRPAGARPVCGVPPCADGLRPQVASLWASLPTYLVHADVAFVTEHHLIAILTIGRLADVTHDVFIILDPQALFGLYGMIHIVVASLLKLLQDPLHGVLV